MLEFLQRDQAVQIGVRGAHVFLRRPHACFLQVDIRHRGLIVGLLRIGILAGDGAVLHQDFVAIPGKFCQILLRVGIVQRGLGLGELVIRLQQLGACLRHLRVQIGCVDIRQYLPFVHAISDVGIALPHIPRGARVEVRFGQRGDVARQQKSRNGRRELHLRHIRRRQCGGFAVGVRLHLQLPFVPRQVSQQEDRSHHNGGDQADSPGVYVASLYAGRQ